MFKKLLVTTAIATASLAAPTMAELDSRVEALEYAGYENWFKFSGNLEYRFDIVEREYKKAYTSSTFSGTTISRAAGEKSNTKHHRIYSELDIEAKPSNKLTFYGRLAMSKYMTTMNKGGGNYAADSAFGEMFEGQGMGNSAIFMERAFVNYNFTDSLVLSVGRLPTIDGSPKHFAEGKPMMGQYPLLAFGGIFDGIALTWAKQFGTNTLKFRGIYTPFNQRNIDSLTDQMKDQNGNKVDDSVDVYSAMVEFEKVSMPWAKRIHFIYQYLKFDGLQAIATGYGVSTTGTVSNTPIGIYTRSNAELGIDRHVAYFEANGIANTGLSMAFSYMTGTAKGSGNADLCLFNSACAGGVTQIGTWYGSSAGEHKGSAWIVNANYQLSILNNAIIGGEYMSADDDAFLYDSASKNLVGEYTARGGSSKHFYWIQPVDNKFKVRVGYQTSQADTTNSFGGYLGAKTSVDNTAKAYYTSMQFSF